MIEFKEEEWTESVNEQMPQQKVKVYENDQFKGEFIVRRYGEYHWMAIDLNVKHFGCGQVIASGQSDTDVRNKAEKSIIRTLEGR